MKYLNNKFYTEVKNDKYIINDGKIYRETIAPKSLKTKYEIMNGVKLEKNLVVIELDDGTLQIQESKKSKKKDEINEEEIIKKYATICKKCNRNFLLEYENEFVCYICGYIVEKTKNQLTKNTKKRKILIF